MNYPRVYVVRRDENMPRAGTYDIIIPAKHLHDYSASEVANVTKNKEGRHIQSTHSSYGGKIRINLYTTHTDWVIGLDVRNDNTLTLFPIDKAMVELTAQEAMGEQPTPSRQQELLNRAVLDGETLQQYVYRLEAQTRSAIPEWVTQPRSERRD